MSYVLDDTTKSIEISLGGAVAANELEWTAHYADYTVGSFTPINSHGVTNGAVDVTMVAAPAANTQRLIQNMSIYNADTGAVTVTIKLDDPAVERRLIVVTLPVGYSLHFKEDMWQVMDTSGFMGMAGPVSGSGVATRVAFWIGATVLSSDAGLYWDNVNKRLGIGTQTPPYEFELQGSNPRIQIDATTGNPIISFAEAGANQWSFYYDTAANAFVFSEVGVRDQLYILDASGHVVPATNKAQDLGLVGSRWREIFCSLALNTGTSRLVPVQKDCAVCQTQLIRGTGGLRVLGEESDFLLAFCPNCGTVAMVEERHRISLITKPAPKIVFTGMEVLKHSGNTKSVVVNFRYGDDVENGEGTVQKAPHNSTTLSDDELAAFLEMTDKERGAFLLNLGQIEWEAMEKMRVIEAELDDEQVQIDSLVGELIGKDLLKEVAG